mmetsp:Transcript_19528/g.61438  ORF Transcript_19528/g.61438 Transcript_19528/m.61438 type:complete len:271 (-) Transcript_19528:161-973(-)
MRTLHCRLPSSQSGSTKPATARSSSGAAATKSMTLKALEKKTQRFGHTESRTSASIAKAVSKAVSSSAAGKPRRGGGPPSCRMVCKNVTARLDNMMPIMHLTYTLAPRLDSGISRKFQMRVARWLRLKWESTRDMSHEPRSGDERPPRFRGGPWESSCSTQALVAPEAMQTLAPEPSEPPDLGERVESLDKSVGGVLSPSTRSLPSLPCEPVERRGEGMEAQDLEVRRDCKDGRRKGRIGRPAACKRFIFTSMPESLALASLSSFFISSS